MSEKQIKSIQAITREALILEEIKDNLEKYNSKQNEEWQKQVIENMKYKRMWEQLKEWMEKTTHYPVIVRLMETMEHE